MLLARIKRREQVEHIVHDFARARIGPVDLVDAYDRLQADLQRLADHELGLRQRPLGGVDQHDGAIHHRQDALHLAAEIGMAGRIDDVDARVVPDDRSGLGEDRDAAFALQVVGVHDPLGDPLVFAKSAGLLEQTVDERRLAVIDVGDDSNVTKMHFSTKKGAGQRPAPINEGAGFAASVAPQYSEPGLKRKPG